MSAAKDPAVQSRGVQLQVHEGLRPGRKDILEIYVCLFSPVFKKEEKLKLYQYPAVAGRVSHTPQLLRKAVRGPLGGWADSGAPPTVLPSVSPPLGSSRTPFCKVKVFEL